MRQYAADDYGAIKERLKEISKDMTEVIEASSGVTFSLGEFIERYLDDNNKPKVTGWLGDIATDIYDGHKIHKILNCHSANLKSCVRNVNYECLKNKKCTPY
jgi:hypothetical protein